MNNTLLWIIILLTAFPYYLKAQSKNIIISGEVIDETSKEPVPYATVALIRKSDDKAFAGTTTLEDGSFSLSTKSKDFYITVSFIGYQQQAIKNLNFEKAKIELGKISLIQDAKSLEEVVVEGEKSTMEFQLDKRVFNVGKDISSTGMGALELLNNVPSVRVDLEGQVSLRGNTGVQILINGKPSVLSDEGSTALNSITSDMVERVEVITNPSAKYEAEGTSGIINIVLKKNEKKGLNGSATINTGIPANHSIGASLNKRTDNFNFFTQFGIGYRSLPSYRENINRNLIENSEIVSDGTEFRNERFYNITLGSDYYINELNTLTLSGSFAFEDESQPSDTDFWIYENDRLISEYKREESTEAGNPKYQYDLQYKKQFKNNKKHVLQFSTLGQFFGKELTSEFRNDRIFGTIDVPDQQRTETDFYEADYTFKLDYTNPVSDRISIETGALYEINDVGNKYTVSDLENGIFVPDSGLTNDFEYDQKVLGIYLTSAYEQNGWGFKLGLRVESTDLDTYLRTTNQENDQDYSNLFPSFHASYKFSDMMSLQAGYSRRIFRPRLWDLNPFFNIRNNFNIRRGNPNLLPEFADSYELTSIFNFEDFSFNTSAYYLYTTDVMDRVTVVENDVSITMPMNIGVRHKTGLEINGKYSAISWLTLSGDLNYGVFRREGVFEDRNFDFNGEQWAANLMSKLKLPADFDWEVTFGYESGFENIQGRVSGYAFLNSGLRKKLLDGRFVVNAAVRDLFASVIRENELEQSDFYLYSFSQRGTFYTLGLSYSFGDGEAMVYTGRRR